MTSANNQSEDIKQQYARFIEAYKKLQNDNAELLKANAELKLRLEEKQNEIDENKLSYDRLKLAKAFGMSEESKKRAHNQLTKLVREIDSCIAILKK